MRYIDAEKLRSVLQNTINSMKEKDIKGERYDAFLNGKLSICEELLGCITSLQQEQPEFVKEIWHKVSEEANLTRPVVLSDGDKYMSPPCTFPFKDMSGFVEAMNKKYKADYTIWAYMDDLLNISSLQQEQPVGEEYAIEIGKGVHTLRVGSQSDIDHLIHQEKQEQPEVDLEKFDKEVTKIWGKCAADPKDSITCFHIETFNEIARHFYELGLNARKEE